MTEYTIVFADWFHKIANLVHIIVLISYIVMQISLNWIFYMVRNIYDICTRRRNETFKVQGKSTLFAVINRCNPISIE